MLDTLNKYNVRTSHQIKRQALEMIDKWKSFWIKCVEMEREY